MTINFSNNPIIFNTFHQENFAKYFICDSKLSNQPIDSFKHSKISSEIYVTNTKRNEFLKEYIEKKAKAEKVAIPKDLKIQISSPENFSQQYKKLLRDVRKNIYKSRVNDMFNLLSKDSEYVEKRVSEMKISDENKAKIINLKEMFDNYYKIEAEYNGRKFNLLNLTEDDKEKLKKISPEFLKFIQEENGDLKEKSIDFTKKEIKNSELSSAGKWSRYLAPVVISIMGLSLYRGFKETKENANKLKNNTKFLFEQLQIYKAGRPKFVNPLKAYKEAFKGAKGAGRILGGTVLASYLWKTLLGSLDDLSGAGKDLIQDTDNFGLGWGLAIAVPSAIMGVLSSAFIAPTIDEHIAFNRAEKYLRKNKMLPQLKGFKKVLNLVKTSGVWAVLGVIIAVCSSGSSWTSMAGTRLLFAHKGDELEKKNIIKKHENTFKATNDNMMQYEAYYGKWDGIAKGDPAIGSIGGGLGLFTHSNPIIQNISFGLQGCSETLTACFVQLFGNNTRETQLDKDKKALIAGIKS